MTAYEMCLRMNGWTMPQTYTVKTPSGGLHFYFKARLGAVYPGKLCPGVDLKSKGYVMAPPSQAYLKRAGVMGQYSVIAMEDVAPAPDWLEAQASSSRSTPLALVTEQVSDHEEVQELLKFVSPDVPYDKWISVLMAIHGATQGSGQGMDLAIALVCSRRDVYARGDQPQVARLQ